MKKLIVVMIVLVVMAFVALPAFATDNICTSSGEVFVQGEYGAYAEGQGDYVVVEVAPGYFQLVSGYYHWVEQSQGGGYYLFIWADSYPCPETNGSSGFVYEESGSWSVAQGSSYQFQHSEGIAVGPGPTVVIWETNDELFVAFYAQMQEFMASLTTWGPTP